MSFHRFLVAAALVFCAAALARADEKSDEARQEFQVGIKHYNVGEYKEALEAFRKGYFAKSDPVFLFNMGQCYRQLGDAEGAARQYRSFLREQPQAPNRLEVEGFIAAADEQVRRKNAEPTGILPTRDAPEAKEPPPSALLVEAKPLVEPPRRTWLLPVALAGVAVVVVAVAVTLVALLVPNNAPVRTGTEPTPGDPMRLALAVLAAATVAGCAPGQSSVYVIVDSDGPVLAVDHFHLDVTISGAQTEADVPLTGRPVDLPPQRSFSLVFASRHDGLFTLQVTARDAANHELARGSAAGQAHPSQSTDLTVTLHSGVLPVDGGADQSPPDLSAIDLAGADLAGADLAGRDLLTANDGAPKDLAAADLVCANLLTDPMNCGGCGKACSSNNITPSCGNGVCNGACKGNYGDCNGNKATDGCEVLLVNDPRNCGTCGNDCTAGNPAGRVCVQSNCGCNLVGECNPLLADSCAANTCRCGNSPPCNGTTTRCAAGTCLLTTGQNCLQNAQCASAICQAGKCK